MNQSSDRINRMNRIACLHPVHLVNPVEIQTEQKR